MRWSLTLLLLFMLGCGMHQEDCEEVETKSECEILAEVSCEKLSECIGYSYRSCLDRYLSEICSEVIGVKNYSSYRECLEGTRSLNCDDSGAYPHPACDEAFEMNEETDD